MNIWHPFTQQKTADTPIKIIRGEKAYLYSEDGRKFLDMISSWWVNILGHSNEEIAKSIYEQAKTLEHVIFAGFSHDPAEKLVAELKKFLPENLDKFFFSDNGSTSVEVALKMAYQYFYNNSIHRNIFINLSGAYHGDTLGAMSASGVNSEYHKVFSEFFFKTFSIDFPETSNDEEESFFKLCEFLKLQGEKVCALIIEPLVQGAAGMRVYRAEFLERIVNEVRKYGILVIFDEVMTGFFRTGTMFATDKLSVLPDFICISKGITGGFLPLSLTVTTEKVYEAFLSDDTKKAFLHGHSYTANPISCAAALKSLEILQRKETIKNIEKINEIHIKRSLQLKNANKKRVIGTISAFDLPNTKDPKDFRQKMLSEGVIIRPINNSVYLIPPYCVCESDLEYVYDKMTFYLS